MTSPKPKRHATTVAAGIFSSRILGLVREAVVASVLGLGVYADVLQAAFRAPNILQNLLGEGTMSAAFIPVYSRFLREGRKEDAGRFAGAVFSLLVVVVAVLVIAGILLARPMLSVLLYNWTNDAALVAAGTLPTDRLDLTVQAVHIVLPMAGLLVLSAWALGILNSHRRFFVPYFAPVLWNLAIITALVAGAWLARDGLEVRDTSAITSVLFAAFVGALVGGVLQFGVQLPVVFRVMKGFRLRLSVRVAGVRDAIVAFGPAVAGRGVSQLSAYVDLFLVSFLAAGAMSALRPALVFYLLPISLFGLSVAAAELPELARMGVRAQGAFLERLRASIRQSMFFTLPTAVGYLAIGFLVVGVCFRRGAFGAEDNYLVWIVLCAYSLGLVATTVSRLLQNAFWALGDTKTPALVAGVRVILSALAAAPLMLVLDDVAVADIFSVQVDGTPLYFGAVGLGLGSAVAAWVELWRLRAALGKRLADFTLPWRPIAGMAGIAVATAASSVLLWLGVLKIMPFLVQAVLAIGCFALLYLGAAWLFKLPELRSWTGRLRGAG